MVNKICICSIHPGGGHLDGARWLDPLHWGSRTVLLSGWITSVTAVNTITDNAVMLQFCDMPDNGGSSL